MVCQICFAYIQELETFLESSSLQWGTITEIGRHWIEISGLRDFIASANNTDISVYSTLAINADDEEMIYKDVIQGRSDPSTFNWEIQQILMRIGPADYR